MRWGVKWCAYPPECARWGRAYWLNLRSQILGLAATWRGPVGPRAGGDLLWVGPGWRLAWLC